jgi:predicted permease
LSIYLILYPILQWGIGSWLLAPDQQHATVKEEEEEVQQNRSIELATRTEDRLESKQSNLGLEKDDEEQLPLAVFGECSDLTITTSSLRSDGVNMSSNLTSNATCNNDEKQQQQQQQHVTSIQPETTTTTKIIRALRNICSQTIQPPVVGAVSGLIVAGIRPLRGLFVDLGGQNRNGGAVLEWFLDGIYLIGQTSVPISMAILGVNLSLASQSKERQVVSSGTIAAVIIGKMIVMPIVGIVTVPLFANSSSHSGRDLYISLPGHDGGIYYSNCNQHNGYCRSEWVKWNERGNGQYYWLAIHCCTFVIVTLARGSCANFDYIVLSGNFG